MQAEFQFKVGDKVINFYNNRIGTIRTIDIEDCRFPYKIAYSSEPHDYDWIGENYIALANMQESDDSVNWKPEGIKFDADKLQWWYLWQFLPELEQVAYVLQYGDKKYPAEDGSNWKRLDNLERRASSAAMRHLSAYLQGNKQDSETDKSHLAHAITNLLFLMYNDRQNASST